jgi:hypothetical protein
LIAIIAFNLVRRGGDSPQKIVGKSEILFRTGTTEARFTHDLHSTIVGSLETCARVRR